MVLPLKELLHTFINPKKNWKTDLLYQWHDIIGSLHDKVRIEKIYNDTITLGVFHPCWIQELYLLSPLLIKKINEKLDQPYIKQIRFKHISTQQIKKNNIENNKHKRNKIFQLTKEDKRLLEKIIDPSLRSALEAFRIRCYQEQ